MASISTSVSLLHRFHHSLSFQPVIYYSKHPIALSELQFGAKVQFCGKKGEKNLRLLRLRCSSENDNRAEDEGKRERHILDSGKYIERLQGTIKNFPPVVYVIRRQVGTNFAVGLCIGIIFLVISLRRYLIRNSRFNYHGSVADLVQRGQLRSDRRGISKPLKYDDPFDNPLVRVSKSNSTVEMCGKVYRLAPVTLTEEEQSSHQKRRSRAYRWKRPTIFLKEGDSIPPDVDPDTVRWIPANHPFATTVSDIDEDLAQNNVYQKRGVPFRIQAEHEALQKKLEALQNDQKLNKLVIDPNNARDFERPFKSLSKSSEHEEQRPSASQGGDASPPKSDRTPRSSEVNSSSDDLQKP